MRVGVVFSQADAGTDPVAVRRWAQRAEEAGFAHLLAYDHVLGASAQRLGPGPFGAFPEAPYTDQHPFWEILTLFGHLAAVTTTLEFVTSVVVLPQRQAALVAKQVATVDRLSGGRLHVAVGTGWNPAEYEGLGADFANRADILEEQIRVLRRLWSEPLVNFSGRFHRLDGVGINPLPDRTIPLWMGTRGSQAALARVARTADGWMPLLAPPLGDATLPEAVAQLRHACEASGRDPATMAVWGRTYLRSENDPALEPALSEALEVGCSQFSVGFACGHGLDHAAQLEAIIAHRARIDALLG